MRMTLGWLMAGKDMPSASQTSAASNWLSQIRLT